MRTQLLPLVLVIAGSPIVRSFVASPVPAIAAHFAPRSCPPEPSKLSKVTQLKSSSLTAPANTLQKPKRTLQETSSGVLETSPPGAKPKRRGFFSMFSLSFLRRRGDDIPHKKHAAKKPPAVSKAEPLSCRVDGDEWECRPTQNIGGKLRVVVVSGRKVAVHVKSAVIKRRESRVSKIPKKVSSDGAIFDSIGFLEASG